jgi:uncharacterized GH25 family protein
MKKFLVCCFVLAVSLTVYAHEFWLQPLKFFYALNESLALSFRVGEEFLGEPWKVKTERIEQLEIHSVTKSLDLRDKIVEDIDKNNVQHILSEEGTHLIAMRSNNAFSDLEAEKFNEYLKEDALDEALAHRRKTNTLDKNGTEFYNRNAKLLVQVGDKVDDTYKKIVGHAVEIVPEQNPYSLKVGDRVSFKILYNGKPLFGAKVRVWNRHDNRTNIQNIFSQQDGVIETHISNKGAWMVSLVKMVPSQDPKADWQSHWASLVFGIK